MAPPDANTFLAELLASHDLPVQLEGGWALVSEYAPPLSAEFVNRRRQGSTELLQLDVRAALPDGRALVESFAGWGPSFPDAAARAYANFAVNSLHVLLGAFFRPPDDQVRVEEWEIGGSRWKAFLGDFGIQAKAGELQPPDGLFPAIEQAIRQLPLDGDTHWFRFFYCNVGTGEVVSEALFDNEPWEAAAEAVRSLPWEKTEAYYSVREFLVLRRA